MLQAPTALERLRFLTVWLRVFTWLLLLTLTRLGTAQTLPASQPVPNLVRYGGTVKDGQGKPLTGVMGITFALYKEEQGGSPLWLETQNVQPDSRGNYTVQLGTNSSKGVPLELFSSGEARWLGVRVEAGGEQPRVLLLSVPYALKAADAATLGGLPPSAFLQGASGVGGSTPGNASGNAGTTAAVTGSGTTNFIPLWTSNSILGNSILYQSAIGNNGAIGINTTSPAGALDVNGNALVRGEFLLPSTGSANSSQGFPSQPFDAITSVFSSSAGQPQNQDFRWQAEPVGNNSSTPSGKLNLLFGANGGNPAETGLSLAANGQITFAPGQSFPGAGTITGVTAGAGMTGGGTSGNVTLGLTNTCATGQVLEWNGATWVCTTLGGGGTITGVTAGTDLTGGGTSGTVTLNLDTTKVPQLNTANTFTGNQTVNGNLTSAGVVAASSYQIGSSLFAFGNLQNQNAFLGFAGNTTMTGGLNTASGAGALQSNSTGTNNTAAGSGALFRNTTGGINTAIGANTLVFNTSGGANTATGDDALELNTTGGSNTATGVQALLNNTVGNYNTGSGLNALGNDTSGSSNTADGVGALFYNTTGDSNTALGSLAGPDSAHPGLSNSTAIGANAEVTASNAMVLGSINGVNGATADTFVGIGTTSPTAKLDVHGNANFTGPITFAPGQTFPGTGTITGVTAGTDLIGGGSSGGVTLNVDTTKVVTGVVAGTDLIGGGTGGVPTLSLDTTKVPQLAAANTFTNNQTVNGNLTATGTVSGNGFSIGGNLFAFGSYLAQNAFLGFGGSTLTTGSSNVAIGSVSLSNTTLGTFNTAVGAASLQGNVTGSGNTALGPLAGPDAAHPDLTNSTAIGGRAQVTASNAMVLGSINGVNNAIADTWVGIGTTAPASTLDVEATAPGLVGPAFLLKNKAPVQAGLGNSVDLRFALDGGSSVGNPNALIRAAEDGNNQYGSWISFNTMADGGAAQGAQERMRIRSDGFVGIGTSIPDALLTVNGGADKVGGGSWGTFSDGRLKNLDGDFQPGLKEVLKLHPVRYRYKDGNGMGINDRDEHIGFVAQDVQKVIPEAVSQNKQGYLLVNNDPILWTMLNAIKEQQQQIGEQREQIRAQQQQIARLSSKVGVLETSLRTARLRDRTRIAIHRSASKAVAPSVPATSTGQSGN